MRAHNSRIWLCLVYCAAMWRPSLYGGVLSGAVNAPDPAGGQIIVRAWQAGIQNEALSLDGKSGSFETAITDLSGSELTVEFWFKGSSIQSAVRQQSGLLEDFKEEWSGRSFSPGTPSEARGWVVVGWNGLHILSNDGLLNGIYYDLAVTNGEWHHLAVTWKQNTRNGFCSYMDGKLYAERDSRDAPIGNYRRNVYFGAWNGNGERAKGLLDEVVIWKRALSPEEIGATWNRKRTGEEKGILAYWNFENSSTADLSTNRFNGALIGGAAIVSAEIPGLGGGLQEIELKQAGSYWFSNLQDGATYRVQAFLDLNGNGICDPSEPDAEKEATVGAVRGVDLQLSTPVPFRRSFWFAGSVGFMILVAVGAVIRLIERRKLNLRVARLQREHQVEIERSRIARDIHDELGGKLARISYMSECCKRGATAENAAVLDALARASRDVLRTLDTIVWAISPKNDSLENLAVYIGEYAREFFQMTKVDCQIEIPPELPSVEITAPVRHNLFRAVQENLNNILKHSEASRVTLSFEMNGSELVIEITDDGRGFSLFSSNSSKTQSNSAKGNGLEIMRQRLQSIGGTLTIESVEMEGTRVKLAWAPPAREMMDAQKFARN